MLNYKAIIIIQMKMKRDLTLILVMLVCTAVMHAATITPAENQKWWGYMGDATKGTSVGVASADTYHCAIFLPGNNDVAGGKKLCAVRFALTATHASNVKVWTASQLPSTTPQRSNTLWMANVDASERGDAIDVALDTPYDIPEEGVFVGYSFTITSAIKQADLYPVITVGSDVPNGFFLRTDYAMPSWSDLYGQGFGVLDVKVLLEGTFADYMVSPATANSKYCALVGQAAKVNVVLTNGGEAAVNSITYTMDGSAEQTLTFDTPLASMQQTSFSLNVDAASEASAQKKTLTVTKVNGNDNQSLFPSNSFMFYTIEEPIQRNVVVEEFTGTGCGWCPRGLVGMEKLRETFGDRFIGIGIHQFNGDDAMYIANYPDLNFSGAPSCRINRGQEIDPYYGSYNAICDDFRAAMDELTIVGVNVYGSMNNAQTEVNVTAIIEPLFDISDYTLELALVADGMSGNTSAWWQSNYYYSYSPSGQPEDLRIFCKGGKYGSSSVKNYVFNDVAIGTSYNSNKNQLPALGTLTGGQKHEVSFTLSMPTKSALRTALKKGTVYVVALVVDDNGHIANAFKRKVGETEVDAVETIHTNVNGTAASYSLSGTQLTSPQRGISIVRQSDGTVRKVIK